MNHPSREIAFDCRFFNGDRPCTFHKKSGVLCKCEHYDALGERVLIVKLDAMGDVLRTTALLPPLRTHHPTAHVTWVTRAESKPLLERNPFIDEVVVYGPDSLVTLLARRFDRVINLDAGKISASLATAAVSDRKDGYVLDARGFVQPTNEAARRWLELGVFDDLKRANTRAYQDLMADILGLSGLPHRYVFGLTEDERQAAHTHLDAIGVDFHRPIIGLNTGAGGRWELKQWREDGYLALIEELHRSLDVQFVLLGGPGERARNERLKGGTRVPLLDPGCDNPVRHFGALLGHCDVVVTGDTLAMHLALALQRRVVVLFGPTSAPEIELYGLGEKVFPDMSCLGCYKMTCDFVPNCMDLLEVSAVSNAVRNQLRLASPEAGRPAGAVESPR